MFEPPMSWHFRLGCCVVFAHVHVGCLCPHGFSNRILSAGTTHPLLALALPQAQRALRRTGRHPPGGRLWLGRFHCRLRGLPGIRRLPGVIIAVRRFLSFSQMIVGSDSALFRVCELLVDVFCSPSVAFGRTELNREQRSRHSNASDNENHAEHNSII